MIAMIVPPVGAYRLECAELLKLLCAALLDDLHLSLECDALGVPNNPNPWTENSQWCDGQTDGQIDKTVRRTESIIANTALCIAIC